MGKLRVDFTGERGLDVGGVARDYFIELSKEMFAQKYALFQNSNAGATYMPNPRSHVQPDHIRYFKFVGRIIGKALIEGHLLECYFVKSMYKVMIGQKLTFRDLEDVDHALYKGMAWTTTASPEEVEALMESFSVHEDEFGRDLVIDLIPNGRNIAVTHETKELFVEKMAYHYLYKSVQQ